MDKPRTIFRVDPLNSTFTALKACTSTIINVKEKHIEEWMAKNPSLLFSNPDAVMVIAQEVSGELMADLLAVDSQGNLIIIEIKRNSSDRNTIGQILDYAARLDLWKYDDFNIRWQDYKKSSDNDLFEAFKEFIDVPDFDKHDFLKEKRLFILASSEDESMMRIITWLKGTYSVPIDFVPFQFYQGFQDTELILLDIEKIEIEPLPSSGGWHGDWYFNTDESQCQGAYKNMFDQSVIAVWGYEDNERRLNEPAPGERVFAYVNGHGIAAVGQIKEGVAFPSDSVFGKLSEPEFNRSVLWEAVVDLKDAISASQVHQWGYNLPVKSSLCRMWNHKVADRIEEDLKKRASKAQTA